jgi:hypothetical protein
MSLVRLLTGGPVALLWPKLLEVGKHYGQGVTRCEPWVTWPGVPGYVTCTTYSPVIKMNHL